MVKVVKLKIVKPTNIDWETFGQLIRDLDYEAFKIKNRATTMLHMLVNSDLEYNSTHDHKINAKIRKEMYGYSTNESIIYNRIKDDYKEFGFYSEIIPGLIRESSQVYSKLLKDILKGTGTIPTYKRNQPIPIRSRMIKILNHEEIQLFLVNRTGAKNYSIPAVGKSAPIQVKVASRKGHANIALKRLLDGRYILSDSHIYKDGKDVYLLITFKDTVVKEVAVSREQILGVHLGIINAVTMNVSGTKKIRMIDGGEIDAFRKRIEKQRISKRNQLRVVSENRKGHGRKTLLSPLDSLSNKVENFKNLTNHRYSKNIVKYAMENGCGIIQMEDLTGIRKENNFLSTWSYYDLQQKVKYKAEEVGIEFKLIKANYTSQRCHKCGNIDLLNRIGNNQFKCTACFYTGDADINASKNISTAGIEKIIESSGIKKSLEEN